LTIHNAGMLNGRYMIVDCKSDTVGYAIDILVHKSMNKKIKIRKPFRVTW
jgi:hypothetical protein